MRIVRSFFALALFTAGCSGAPETPPLAPTAAPSALPPPSASVVATGDVAPRPAPRADATLIARSVLFGNPDRSLPTVSPDGKHLAYLAPEGGVMNVWVAPIGDLAAAKAVTHETKRGIRSYSWAYSSAAVIYPQDKGGNEDFHLYIADTGGGAARDLTPMDGVTARLEMTSSKLPKEAVIALNQRDPKNHDLYRVDLATGKLTRLAENTQGFAGYLVDDDFHVRFALHSTADGGQEILKPAAKDTWVTYAKIPKEDSLTTELLGFDHAGKVLYLLDSRGRDTSALFALDVAKDKATLLAEDARADMSGVLVHPVTGRIQAVSSTRERAVWKVIDPAIQGDFDALRAGLKGDLGVVSRSLDDRTWIVAATLDDGPVRYARYDRPSKKIEPLFSNRKSLEGVPLASMHPEVIKARDGLELVSYLTLPRASDPDGDGKPSKALPMVLLVHGGPWARDQWGLNSTHQWLANRGYAVLSVSFRGSTGFGKKFTNAGDKEWGARMHDDLLDAVKWSVDGGVADPAKVAIMGGSYGGYATLVGMTFTPDTFACGVDIVGPSNLATLLATIPPYWAPLLSTFSQRVGDPSTEEGKTLLHDRSPLFRAGAIKRPLLIGQGANDPRVKQAEADQIVAAMQAKKIPVTYVLYADEGHGFQRPENKMSFNAVTETFLAQCLGGSYQPVGDDFKGSSIAVPAGADQVTGIVDAVSKK
jgi:dipeptidyl aminopeptidase/acylaminoacyl peptidase